MSLYCGIDLHSNNHVVVVIDGKDKRLVERRVPNDLGATLSVLEPFREDVLAVAVESTYNWYWLVDGLADHGYSTRLVNTAAVQQYSGLKYSGDRHDAFWLAHLMRLGILPTGYICPREIRVQYWGQVLFLAAMQYWGQVLFLAASRRNARNKT